MYYGAPRPAYVAYPQPKKQAPIGIVITLLGLLGTGISVVMLIAGGWFGIGAFGSNFGQPDSVNSELAGSTATYEFEGEALDMFAIYVPESDASSVSCTAHTTDGERIQLNRWESAEGSTAGSSTIDLNGQDYVRFSDYLGLETNASGTISCDNLSEGMAVSGPLSGMGILGGFVGGIGGGLLVGLISSGIVLLGFTIMIIRAMLR